MDFRCTFVVDAPWDKDELIRFWGHTVKDQGLIITVHYIRHSWCTSYSDVQLLVT